MGFLCFILHLEFRFRFTPSQLFYAELVLCELRQDMLQTGMIVGGWDKYEGGKIYGIPLGGTIIEQPFAIGGTLLELSLYN